MKLPALPKSEKPSGFFPGEYLRKPQPPVTAVQWQGTNREQINALFVGISPLVAYIYKGAGDTLVLTTPQVNARVDVGSWVVKRSEKDIYLVEQDAFAELYQPATFESVRAATSGVVDRDHVTFTDIAGDKLTIYKGALEQSVFLRTTEYGNEESRTNTLSVLFTPADMRGIADVLLRMADDIEGRTNVR